MWLNPHDHSAAVSNPFAHVLRSADKVRGRYVFSQYQDSSQDCAGETVKPDNRHGTKV